MSADIRKMKHDISVLIVNQTAIACGMTVAEYMSVYDSNAHELMLEEIMTIIRADPIQTRFQIGQAVWHDGGEAGVVKAINLNEPNGYFYQVAFTIENGLIRQDWYRGAVLHGEPQ